jgi:hypothetical protein
MNEDFDRLMRQADEAPNRILAEIADTGRRNGPAMMEPAGRLTDEG